MKEKILRFTLVFVMAIITLLVMDYSYLLFKNEVAYVGLCFSLIILTVIMSLIILKDDLKGGCGGNCHQGRRPCDCKKPIPKESPIEFHK